MTREFTILYYLFRVYCPLKDRLQQASFAHEELQSIYDLKHYEANEIGPRENSWEDGGWAVHNV